MQFVVFAAQYLSQVWDGLVWVVRYLFENSLSTILAVVATWIAINQRREQKYAMRVENLQKIVKSLRAERYRYSEESLDYYRKHSEDPALQIEYVLFREGWMQKKGDEEFVPLDAVDLRFRAAENGGVWDSGRNPQPRFLPSRRDGYAENAKFHCDVNLMNLPLYGLGGLRTERIEGKKRVTLEIVKGRYYDFYDTCEVLSAEMACRRRIKQNHQAKLRLRDRCRDVLDLSNRFVGIGINVLTIIEGVEDRDGKQKNHFLLHKRSGKNVAEGANSYHVVPAGSYQPATVEFPKTEDPPDSLDATVIREFYEELMGYEEFSDLFNAKLLMKVRHEWPELYFIGVGLDPLNTKAELLACLRLSAEKLCPPEAAEKDLSQKERIEALLQDSYEGTVGLKELTYEMLKQYRDNPKSIPGFRQLLQVVCDHGSFFGVED